MSWLLHRDWTSALGIPHLLAHVIYILYDINIGVKRWTSYKVLKLTNVQNRKQKQNTLGQSKTNKIGFNWWLGYTSKPPPLKWGPPKVNKKPSPNYNLQDPWQPDWHLTYMPPFPPISLGLQAARCAEQHLRPDTLRVFALSNKRGMVGWKTDPTSLPRNDKHDIVQYMLQNLNGCSASNICKL